MACWMAGDLLVVTFGHLHNSIPGLASGLTGIGAGGNQVGGPLGIRTGYRVLQTGDTTAVLGTFSSSAAAGDRSWSAVIYRGVHATPIGKIGGTGGTTTTTTYPALTAPLNGGSTSWVIGLAHGNGTPTNLALAPGAMVNRHTQAGTNGPRRTINDTNAAVSSWASTTRNHGLNNWQSQVIELRAAASGSLSFIDQYGAQSSNQPTIPAECPVGFLLDVTTGLFLPA
jgi:hypothetical protein